MAVTVQLSDQLKNNAVRHKMYIQRDYIRLFLLLGVADIKPSHCGSQNKNTGELAKLPREQHVGCGIASIICN